MPELKPGGVFPPQEDLDRMRGYRQHSHLFDGDHQNHIKAHRIRKRLERANLSAGGISAAGVVYMVVNLPRLIAEKHADILTLRQPVIMLGDSEEKTDAFQKRLASNNPMLWADLHAGIAQKRALGDMILMPRQAAGDLDNSGAVSLRVGDPRNWYPCRSSSDPLEFDSHQIAWVEEHYTGDSRTESKPFLRVDTYQNDGSMQRTAFTLEGRNGTEGNADALFQYTIKAAVDLSTYWGDLAEAEKIDGLDGFGIVHIPNGRDGDALSPFGRSDYLDSGGLFDNVNETLSKWSRANDKVAQMPRAVPHKYLRTDEDTGEVIEPSHYEENFYGEKGAREADSSSEDYPRWMDAKLAYETLEAEFDASFLTACIQHSMAPSLLGYQTGNEKESGEAKSLGMTTTDAAARRDLMTVRPGVERALSIMAQMTGESEPVSTIWRPGLPKSEKEIREEIKAERDMGLLSKFDAIKRLSPHMTEDQIKKQLARVGEDQAADDARDEVPFIARKG